MTIRLERFRSAFYRLLSSSRSAEPRVYVIEIDKLAFGPAPEGLRVNDIVEWTNVDIFRHTASATDGASISIFPAGATGQTERGMQSGIPPKYNF